MGSVTSLPCSHTVCGSPSPVSSIAVSSLPSYSVCLPPRSPSLRSSDTLLRLIPETCPESSFHRLLYKPIPPCDSLLDLQASSKFHPFLGTIRISSRAGSLQLPKCTQSSAPPACVVFGLLLRTDGPSRGRAPGGRTQRSSRSSEPQGPKPRAVHTAGTRLCLPN